MPTFVDVAEESGVDLLALSGTPYKAYIVESTTGGTSVFDYDNDGDIYIMMIVASAIPTWGFTANLIALLPSEYRPARIGAEFTPVDPAPDSRAASILSSSSWGQAGSKSG